MHRTRIELGEPVTDDGQVPLQIAQAGGGRPERDTRTS